MIGSNIYKTVVNDICDLEHIFYCYCLVQYIFTRQLRFFVRLPTVVSKLITLEFIYYYYFFLYLGWADSSSSPFDEIRYSITVMLCMQPPLEFIFKSMEK